MDECVPTTAKVYSHGYGQFWRNGKTHYAHRAAWEEVHGPIPPGLQIHHVCGNRVCVNVQHLELRTCSEHPRLHRHCDHEERVPHKDGTSHCRVCANEYHNEWARRRYRNNPAYREMMKAKARKRRQVV